MPNPQVGLREFVAALHQQIGLRQTDIAQKFLDGKIKKKDHHLNVGRSKGMTVAAEVATALLQQFEQGDDPDDPDEPPKPPSRRPAAKRTGRRG